eukprot:TRINITY_DN2833_c0_g1_i2.p1 TRINITY_DN2833_c0_g1~~TRINITY_DN2833_c0_g1_i2.p1  ORF type:complete len:185 (-),score=43.87 TRINITY_DN2833_c0_g1_i2:127-615(-)
MADAVPDGWLVKESRSQEGRRYYFNPYTKESTWDLPTEPAARDVDGDQVRAMHILVKHEESRRPASWKSPTITRSKQEAIEILQGYIAQLQGVDNLQEAFSKIASTESDCSSAKAGGDLGKFGHGTMQKPFEDASFGLKVGTMSGVVDTDSGVHIIMRIPLN